MRTPLARLAVGLAGLSAFTIATASLAVARDRVVLERVTKVYPALPPGTYYPVAQGLFGDDARRVAPVYVYVAPNTWRRSPYWQRPAAPPLAYSVPRNPAGWAAPAPSVRSAPWMDYPAVNGMAAYGCRACMVVNARAPVTVTRTFYTATACHP